MQNTVIKMTSQRGKYLFAIGATALVAAFGALTTHAATDYVITDPNEVFYGYENVYTNGLTTTTWPAYISQYLGSGGSGQGAAFPNDSSSDLSGNVTIGADDWADITSPYSTDTDIWADASGTSAAICDVVSDIYCQYGSAAAGDTVIFTGSLVTNSLSATYSNNAVVFIKDYDSSWSMHSFVTVHLTR
jgi:hypothetical protein